MTGPVVLSRTITNTFNETRSSAQYIGDLNNYGTFDIALTGTLAVRDKGDYYQFRVTSDSTYLRLAALGQTTSGSSSSSSAASSSSNGITGALTSLISSGQLRIQLYSQTGQLVADSDSSAGSAYTAYQALTNGNLQVNTGYYTVKVSPGENATPNTAYNYLFSIAAGATPVASNAAESAREEFQTTANPASSSTLSSSQTNGWLPSVLLPSNTSTAVFSSLENYVSNPEIGGSIDVAG